MKCECVYALAMRRNATPSIICENPSTRETQRYSKLCKSNAENGILLLDRRSKKAHDDDNVDMKKAIFFRIVSISLNIENKNRLQHRIERCVFFFLSRKTHAHTKLAKPNVGANTVFRCVSIVFSSITDTDTGAQRKRDTFRQIILLSTEKLYLFTFFVVFFPLFH